MDFESHQFFILTSSVGISTYIGGVARETIKSIKKDSKRLNADPRKTKEKCIMLGFLLIGDIFLFQIILIITRKILIAYNFSKLDISFITLFTIFMPILIFISWIILFLLIKILWIKNKIWQKNKNKYFILGNYFLFSIGSIGIVYMLQKANYSTVIETNINNCLLDKECILNILNNEQTLKIIAINSTFVGLVGYMTLIHILQWCNWTKVIVEKYMSNTEHPNDELKKKSEYRSQESGEK